MYGSPKVYKREVILRPIFSRVNAHNFLFLSTFLFSLLAQLCNTPYGVKDSFRLAKEIQSFHNNNYFIASFDDVSLPTKIPVNEYFNII